MVWGILSGIIGAAVQNAGYIFSRIYIKQGGRALGLLTGTQLYSGTLALLTIFFVLPDRIRNVPLFFLTLLGAAFGALGGQFFFFAAEKKMEPSRVSSLMSLRIVTSALALAVFAGDRYNRWQISGMVLAVAAAFLINRSRTGFSFRGMGKLSLSLACYLFSDLSIVPLIRSVVSAGLVRSSLFALCCVNLVQAAAVLSIVRKYRLEELEKAASFAFCWFIKQFFLYFCYAVTGPVFGNVILSLRGPMEVAAGNFLSRKTETPARAERDRIVWRYRWIGSLLMCCAVVLYAFG